MSVTLQPKPFQGSRPEFLGLGRLRGAPEQQGCPRTQTLLTRAGCSPLSPSYGITHCSFLWALVLLMHKMCLRAGVRGPRAAAELLMPGMWWEGPSPVLPSLQARVPPWTFPGYSCTGKILKLKAEVNSCEELPGMSQARAQYFHFQYFHFPSHFEMFLMSVCSSVWSLWIIFSYCLF